MTIAVPATFSDVTPAWFQDALREGGMAGVELASVSVEPMPPSKGLIGDLATVHVTYRSGSGPDAFVIKLPAANPGSRQIGDMLHAYAREVAFYRDVAPQATATQLAKCFYAGADEQQHRWAVLLEAIDGDEFDVMAGATIAQADAAVDALADFHARWWDADAPFEWMPGFDVIGVGGLQPHWLANLPTFVERYHSVLPSPTADWVLAFAPRLSAWSARAAREPLTMVHSDYRIDNLLFQGDRVTMIDWQTAMRAPAAMDLSCFITTSLSVVNRRANEASLIDRYLARLAMTGIVVDRSWFDQSYDENVLWWMGQFGNNLSHLDPGDDQTQAALTTMVERVYTAALDRNIGRLLESSD